MFKSILYAIIITAISYILFKHICPIMVAFGYKYL